MIILTIAAITYFGSGVYCQVLTNKQKNKEKKEKAQHISWIPVLNTMAVVAYHTTKEK